MPVAVRRMDGTRRVPTATLGLDVEEKRKRHVLLAGARPGGARKQENITG